MTRRRDLVFPGEASPEVQAAYDAWTVGYAVPGFGSQWRALLRLAFAGEAFTRKHVESLTAGAGPDARERLWKALAEEEILRSYPSLRVGRAQAPGVDPTAPAAQWLMWEVVEFLCADNSGLPDIDRVL